MQGAFKDKNTLIKAIAFGGHEITYQSWYGIEDLEAALTRLNIGQYYSQRSWTCLLAGVGIFPRQENLSVADEANRLAAQSDLDYVDKFIAGCSLNFQPHARVLVSD